MSTSSKLISLYLRNKHASPIVVKSTFNTGVTSRLMLYTFSLSIVNVCAVKAELWTEFELALLSSVEY